MGTSGAFGGSGGKAAKDLRDEVADWLADLPVTSHDIPSDEPAESPAEPSHDGGEPGQRLSPAVGPDLSAAVRLLIRRGGGGDGPGGGGGRGGSGDGGRRSGGGAHRSVGRMSRSAGRAGALARAYVTGNRTQLASAGLDYNELAALGPIEAGIRIVQAAFAFGPDSTIADSEERAIAAEIVEWIIGFPADQVPSPDEVARKSIEEIVVAVTLTEVGARVREDPSPEKRRAAEREIRETAEAYANRIQLSGTGATDQEMSQAIEGGIRQLGVIFGVGR